MNYYTDSDRVYDSAMAELREAEKKRTTQENWIHNRRLDLDVIIWRLNETNRLLGGDEKAVQMAVLQAGMAHKDFAALLSKITARIMREKTES